MISSFFLRTSNSKLLKTVIRKKYSKFIEKEFDVPTFCDLHVQVPYRLHVKPLNVHKYHNCDKLILKVDERIRDTLDVDLNGNQIKIINNEKPDENNDHILGIKAPVKANLYINALKDITVGYFHGDKLYLESRYGNITINKYQGNEVRLITHNGNIAINDYIQASDIDAVVLCEGNISAERLQSMNLKLQTKHGNISVNSSYSHESLFSTSKGNVDLTNTHKSCQIFIEDGNLNLVGFDGHLKAIIDKGSANIQLARITNDSEINIMKGSLALKLSDACQEHTGFKLNTLDWEVPETVKMTVTNCDGIVNLVPDMKEDNIVEVNCIGGSIDVDSASWQDMLIQKFKNNNSQV